MNDADNYELHNRAVLALESIAESLAALSQRLAPPPPPTTSGGETPLMRFHVWAEKWGDELRIMNNVTGVEGWSAGSILRSAVARLTEKYTLRGGEHYRSLFEIMMGSDPLELPDAILGNLPMVGDQRLRQIRNGIERARQALQDPDIRKSLCPARPSSPPPSTSSPAK